ncbi:MAG: hypothetical protein HC893_13770 [Chloroflexaceae bacterium]|nr:hypothetical protein [Chloroflexaceae bacterium]
MLIYEITRRCMQRFITAGVVLYALGMLVLVGLWTLVPQLHALVAFTNIFALYFFLPLVVVLPLALAQRSQALRAMAAVLVVLFGVLFGPRMLPVLARPAGEPTLRVITFNQFIDNQDIAGSVAVLTAQQADIVALQELSPEMAAALSRLEAQYPYQWLEPQPVPGGLGILSRYPLTYAGRWKGYAGSGHSLRCRGSQSR